MRNTRRASKIREETLPDVFGEAGANTVAQSKGESDCVSGVKYIRFGKGRDFCSIESVKESTQGLQVPVVGGRNFVGECPVFSNKRKYVMCCMEDSVKVISIVTGKTVMVLSTGEGSQITSVCALEEFDDVLVASCANGGVYMWNMESGECIGKMDLEVSISEIRAVKGADESAMGTLIIYALTKGEGAKSSKKKESFKVLRFEALYKGNVFEKRGAESVLFKASNIGSFCVDRAQQYVVATAKQKLYVYDMKGERLTKYKNSSKSPLTKCVIHPNGEFVATGDAKGEIRTWYVLGNQIANADDKSKTGDDGLKSAVTTSMHWHSHAVTSLAFTSNGAYLLSGGEEGVLVTWQLASGQSNFLPRLGGPICNIWVSADDELFGVALSNNTIKLVSSITNSVVTTIQGMRKPRMLKKPELLTGCSVNPNNGFVVLNSGPGVLQVHDVFSDSHVNNYTISRYNVVSRTENAHIAYPFIEHCSFSHDGRHMATIERRDDHANTGFIKMKLWQFDDDVQDFVNNTIIDAPHSARVMDVKFNPKDPLVLVTCGMDKKFRVWKASRNQDGSFGWYNHCVGFYKDFLCRSVDFSEDGSILAVSCGQTVSLWDPEANVLKSTLTHPPPFEHINCARFIPGTPFLVAFSDNYIHVWNMITCSVWWSQKLNVAFVSISKTSKTFVAFALAKGGKRDCIEVAYRFSVNLPMPLECIMFGNRMGRIVSATHASRKDLGEDKEELVVFLSDRSFFVASEGSNKETNRGILLDNALAGPDIEESVSEEFEAVFSANVLYKAPNEEEKASKRSTKSVALENAASCRIEDEFFAAPSHALLPVNKLYKAFVSRMLERRGKNINEVLNFEIEKDGDSKESTMEAASEEVKSTAEDVLVNNFGFLASTFTNICSISESPVEKEQAVEDDSSKLNSVQKGFTEKGSKNVKISTPVNGNTKSLRQKLSVDSAEGKKNKTKTPKPTSKSSKNCKITAPAAGSTRKRTRSTS
eukprot:Nk52_evm6s2171 gene=Nk52_evmTU6s2171